MSWAGTISTKAWLAEVAEEGQHIMPLEDLRDHEAHEECWCKPVNDEGIWIHNAMDRREEYEEGRKLS